MRLLMLPNDVLFLNSGREFTAGETHLGVTQSFVPPHTAAGAIRSALYLKNSTSYDYLIRAGEEEPGFEMLGAFFWKGVELFPLPADIVEDEDGRLVQASLSDDVVTASGSVHFKPATGFLGMGNLRDYLSGKSINFGKALVPVEEVYTLEDRVGIGLDEKKTTVEGMLYRTRNLRLKEGVGVSVWLGERGEELRKALGEGGLLQLGGEGRFVRYSFEDSSVELSHIEAPEGTLLRLYVATPLILPARKNGRLYSTWDIRGELARALGIDGGSIKVRWFFSGGILPLTGWDMARKHPKTVHYAVAPGSVYYVEIDEPVSIPSYLKLGELRRLGYGLVLPGKTVEG